MMTLSDHMMSDQDARVGAEADRWSARLAKGPLTTDEARAFNRWMAADPAHERQFQAAQAFTRELTRVPGADPYTDWMRPSLYERAAKALHDASTRFAAPQRPAFRWAAIGGAAVLAAICVAVVLLSTQTSIAPSSPALVTEIAELRDVALPDGSVVTLGAASSVTVAFTERERRVYLAQGEAFFDVKSDPERPFIVVAENTLVRVLGTKFDVSLGTDAIDVAVSEGRVEVIRPESGRSVIREKDVKHVLVAGQKVTTPKRGKVEPVRPIKVEDVASWRRGELVWADTPLKDIVADLNRYSTGGIELQAGRVADLDYTLAVQADDIAGAVQLIAASLDLEVVELDNGATVIR